MPDHPRQQPPHVVAAQCAGDEQHQASPGIFVYPTQPLQRLAVYRPVGDAIAAPEVVPEPGRLVDATVRPPAASPSSFASLPPRWDSTTNTHPLSLFGFRFRAGRPR